MKNLLHRARERLRHLIDHRPRSRADWAALIGRILNRLEPKHQPMRNPLEFVLCLVLAANIIPSAIGARPLPNSLENSLPVYAGQVSAALLVLGCVGVAVGIAWRNRDMGIVIQQSFMWLVMVSLFTYGLALGTATHWSSQGAYAGGVCFGLAAGFAARIGQFQLWVRRRKRLAVVL